MHQQQPGYLPQNVSFFMPICFNKALITTHLRLVTSTFTLTYANLPLFCYILGRFLAGFCRFLWGGCVLYVVEGQGLIPTNLN